MTRTLAKLPTLGRAHVSLFRVLLSQTYNLHRLLASGNAALETIYIIDSQCIVQFPFLLELRHPQRLDVVSSESPRTGPGSVRESIGTSAPSAVSAALILVSLSKISRALNILSFKTSRRNLEKSIDSSTPFTLIAIDPHIAHKIVTNTATSYGTNSRNGVHSYAVDVYVQMDEVFSSWMNLRLAEGR